MKPLSEKFLGRGEVRGFEFNQLKASDKAYLYEVITEGQRHYEVFKTVINQQFNCISYPRSGAFGIWAWCCLSLQRAENKFNELNQV